MKTKVTIIGAGSVGATTAYSLLARDAATEVVLIDVNAEKALGEALDIKQATPFLDNCDIYAGDYRDAVGSQFVVITSGIGRKPGQTRLELVQTNVDIIKSVAQQIVKYAPDATYIIVANPVDILTYAFLKFTGLPKNQVLGTGTLLDTIRLRTRLAEIYNVNKKQVHANVLAEHGDSSFIAWSTATIAGVPLEEYNNAVATTYSLPTDYSREDVETYVKKSGGKIIARKGCTIYGVATSTMHIIKTISGNAGSLMTVSSLHDGEYGIKDVCLSSLSVVDHSGVKSIITQKLSDDEMNKLYHSAEVLKEIIRGTKF
ncbi:MAG: L-lactate dehydrogenase [Ruminococcus sp.]|nr:L-lactate dehydrogenase [Ruminococcus sp.]